MITILLLLGCRPEPSEPPASEGVPSPQGSLSVDPFAPQSDTSEGLTNISDDLEAILEHGELISACERWTADPTDRRQELLCGKYLFFYEGFGTLGIPSVLFDYLPGPFEDELGPAYSRLGLVPHPTDPNGRPIGFGHGALLEGNETLALTCASCHFGPLGDGRYAVGAPNHGYDYGRHMLVLMLAPLAIAPSFRESDHHPDALAAIRPLLDRIADDRLLKIQMGIEMLPLLSAAGAAATLDMEQEGQYASWRTGTMDFLIAPLPVDDELHTVSKISALWGIPIDSEITAAHMPNAMLGWTGGTESLTDFLRGFVQIGEGDAAFWTEERLQPLRSYIESLRPPEPRPADEALVSQGEDLFFTEGCIHCHGAPRGSGDRVYTFDEIGTESSMMAWADPELDGVICCGLGESNTALTHGIKSPRLVGLASFERLLHNGSLDTLEQLLCLEARPDVHEAPWSSDGHTFGCELPQDERRALAAYLRAH